MNPASRNSPPLRRIPWLESLAAIAILLGAWLFGFFESRSPVAPLVPNVLPEARSVEAVGETFVGYDADGKVVGYAAAADATGYGGPIYLLVGVNPQGQIEGIQVIEQRETPGFYALLRDKHFVQQFLGRPAKGPFVVGQDIDSVSGASLSAEGVALAIQHSTQKIQAGGLVKGSQPIQFGWPEIVLLALFGASIALTRVRDPRRRKRVRWAVLLVAMVVLGFMLNEPLTLGNIASLLVGYWPAWQDHLYWYIMLAGGLGLTLVWGKNLYCYSICPFGTVQDCFGALGVSRPYLPPAAYHRMKWLPRWLAVLALALGLAFRQPGTISFEPFGTLFSFSAGFFPWMLLVFVLFGSMVLLRPFCYYLCPVGAVMSFLLFLNHQVKRIWKNQNKSREQPLPRSS